MDELLAPSRRMLIAFEADSLTRMLTALGVCMILDEEGETTVRLEAIASHAVRGSGIASDALSHLCAFADQFGVDLVLQVCPMQAAEQTQDGLDVMAMLQNREAPGLKDLRLWYERHDFVAQSDAPQKSNAMLRRARPMLVVQREFDMAGRSG